MRPSCSRYEYLIRCKVTIYLFNLQTLDGKKMIFFVFILRYICFEVPLHGKQVANK
jgi:hypothetical protein